MEIYTLQDFLTLTKGQEYLFALAAIGVFGLFWYLLDRKPGKRKVSGGERDDIG